jgi:FkbM family methyltransferase
MLVRELLPLIKDVARIVDVSRGRVDLRRHLVIPSTLPYTRVDPDDLGETTFGEDTLLLCLIGPDEAAHTPADALSPVLRALPTGAKVLMLAGWAAETFPYHLVLGPLGDGRCQVTDAVPVDQSARHGLHVALLAERVAALLPPRAYLMDVRTDDEQPVSAGPGPASDPLAVQLRAVNEHLLGELVARPVRRRVRELDDRVVALEAQLAAQSEDTTALRTELKGRDRDLARLRQRLSTLESSPTFRLGRTLVDGARHPGRAVVTVPVNLAKIWRAHRARAAAPPVAPAAAAKPTAKPTHRTVSIPVPGSPQRVLSLTAPVALLVPRKLAKDGLAGYEASAVPCFLAAMDTAGPGAVLDIGANVGLYAALAAAVTDREVAAFEPFPTLSEVAERFAADNDLEFRIEPIALGRETGTATLYLSDSSDSSNSLAPGFRESTRQIEVPVETLDGYVQRTGVVPAVIKIDTESTEPDVLFGAAETLRVHRPWVLCEVLAGRVEERLTEAMAPHGYHWYPITDEVPYESATIIEGDRSYKDLMWLFAPEVPDDAFWAAVTAWRAGIVAAQPAPSPAPAQL